MASPSPVPACSRRSGRREVLRRALLTLFRAILLCACAASAQAATHKFAIDTAQSHVEFGVRVMWLLPVHGRFTSVRGTVTIDDFRGAAQVEALIDAADVHMRRGSDENWIKSQEFFDVQHFPQIQFVSEAFSLDRLEKGGDVTGMLTIRGVTKPARFMLRASNCAQAIGRDCPVEAEGSIHRSEFGMRSRRGALSDKVDLEFSIRVKSEP